MPDPAIICLGATVFDRVLSIERFPVSGIKIRASRWEHRGGGPAATAAVCAVALGVRAALWSRVGDDPEGEMTLRLLAAKGVDIAHTHVLVGGKTSQAVVLVDPAGERLIVGHPANGSAADDASLRPLADEVGQAGAALADASWPDGAAALFQAARARRVPSVLDGDLGHGDPRVLERLSALADFAIYSEVGWHVLTGLDAPDAEAMRAIHARTGAVPAVTGGSRGSWWFIDGAVRHVAAIAVSVRDTTGAGDVFHGAFAVALALDYDVAAAARFATAAAALKCRMGDGWNGMPDRAAVERLMGEKV